MTDYLVVGRLGKPHGVWGEVRLYVMTDFPERLKRGVTVYLGDEHRPERIRSFRNMDEYALATFEGYGDRETAETLRNETVYVRADDRPPLEEGEYYHHQIIGLSVYADEYKPDIPPIGKVKDILETGANDVLIIEDENGGQLLLPMLDETILKIDPTTETMVVHLLPGLI